MKFSHIVNAVVLSVVLTPAVYASGTPVYSVELPIASYVSHGEDCSLPLEGYENTDWFPANYHPLVLPVWKVSQAHYLEHTINDSPVRESITYLDNMADLERLEMLQAMEHYAQSIIDTDDEDYIDCLSIVDSID